MMLYLNFLMALVGLNVPDDYDYTFDDLGE